MRCSCLLLVAACVAYSPAEEAGGYEEPVEALRWVETASAEQYFAEDRRVGRRRFFLISAYSEYVPGLGVNYDACYSKVAETTLIRGTGDVLLGPEHIRLTGIAVSFAQAYNALMKNYLDQNGLSACDQGADWEAAFRELTPAIWGPDQTEGLVGLLTDQAGSAALQIDLKRKERAEEMAGFACKLLARHHILRETKVEVHEWLPGPGYRTRLIQPVVCRNGVRDGP
jgi:hypothetical protein